MVSITQPDLKEGGKKRENNASQAGSRQNNKNKVPTRKFCALKIVPVIVFNAFLFFLLFFFWKKKKETTRWVAHFLILYKASGADVFPQ